MAIYTKSGDKGTTSNAQGERLSKTDMLFEVLGSLDELNSALGLITAYLDEEHGYGQKILRVQSDLLTIGSLLAGHKETGFEQSKVTTLENEIDRMESEVPKLTSFILPGGTLAAAHTHVARSVCRRLERRFVQFKERQEPIRYQVIGMFLNRLSDWLFQLARYINFKSKKEDTPWIKNVKTE